MNNNVSNNCVRKLADFMVDAAQRDIDNHEFKQELLNAMNAYEENERDGADYIYDSDNNDDMAHLCKCGWKVWEIANKTNDEFPYVRIVYQNSDTCLESIDGAKLEKILAQTIYELMPYVVLYHDRVSAYAPLWQRYVIEKYIY